MGTMKDPTIIPCGHTYCGSCIKGIHEVKPDDGHLYGLRRKTVKLHKFECPTCRAGFHMEHLKPNFMMRMAMEEMQIESDDEEDKEP